MCLWGAICSIHTALNALQNPPDPFDPSVRDYLLLHRLLPQEDTAEHTVGGLCDAWTHLFERWPFLPPEQPLWQYTTWLETQTAHVVTRERAEDFYQDLPSTYQGLMDGDGSPVPGQNHDAYTRFVCLTDAWARRVHQSQQLFHAWPERSPPDSTEHHADQWFHQTLQETARTRTLLATFARTTSLPPGTRELYRHEQFMAEPPGPEALVREYFSARRLDAIDQKIQNTSLATWIQQATTRDDHSVSYALPDQAIIYAMDYAMEKIAPGIHWRSKYCFSHEEAVRNLPTWKTRPPAGPHPFLVQTFQRYDLVYQGTLSRTQSAPRAILEWIALIFRDFQGAITTEHELPSSWQP